MATPPPDPYRLRVQKAISAVLKEITPANGYQHDLSNAVFRGRNIFGESDPLPMVSILEAPIQPDAPRLPDGGATQNGPWELVIQGFVDDDKRNPTDPAHRLLADVKKRLAQECKAYVPGGGYKTFGMEGKLGKLTIGTGVVRPPDEISSKAYFWLTINLQLFEAMDDPYG